MNSTCTTFVDTLCMDWQAVLKQVLVQARPVNTLIAARGLHAGLS